MKRSVITLVVALLAAGCNSSGTGASAGTLRLAEKDDGHVVRVHTGETIVLQLHSTYWQVAPAAGHELALTSRKTVAVPLNDHRCVPGQGCGTVTVRFKADHAGRTTIRAGRTGCGEARACVGSEGSYAVAVVVS